MNGFPLSAAVLTPDDWSALICLYDETVFLSLLASGVRPARARELCHDTWARLYEQWRTGRLDVLKLPGLAVAQARFLTLIDGRRARTVPAAAEVGEVLECPDLHASPEERFASRELLTQVERALEACPLRARQLFELAFEHPDVSHAELAQRSGISLQRLRQTLCEVRARLRAALKEER